jgi:hypothetical protein
MGDWAKSWWVEGTVCGSCLNKVFLPSSNISQLGNLLPFQTHDAVRLRPCWTFFWASTSRALFILQMLLLFASRPASSILNCLSVGIHVTDGIGVRHCIQPFSVSDLFWIPIISLLVAAAYFASVCARQVLQQSGCGKSHDCRFRRRCTTNLGKAQ